MKSNRVPLRLITNELNKKRNNKVFPNMKKENPYKYRMPDRIHDASTNAIVVAADVKKGV